MRGTGQAAPIVALAVGAGLRGYSARTQQGPAEEPAFSAAADPSTFLILITLARLYVVFLFNVPHDEAPRDLKGGLAHARICPGIVVWRSRGG